MKGAWGIGVAVVAVVACVSLWPILTAGQPGGSPDACLARLGKLSSAMQLYANDYDGRLMPSEGWQESVGRYAGSNDALHCPAVSSFGYAFRGDLGAQKIQKVASPSTAAVVFDSKILRASAVGDLGDLPSPPRHGRFNSILYLDGHGAAVDAAGQPSKLGKP